MDRQTDRQADGEQTYGLFQYQHRKVTRYASKMKMMLLTGK